MLTPLDDSLWHQIASPFENVGTSDHRFFDRMWFAVYDPAGSGALQFTIGVYNNMNVIDGGFVVIRDTTQYNLRTSRSLRPRFEPAVGAMRIDVVEPFEHIRLIVEPGEHHVHGELHWRAVLPPELEKPHVARIRGRLNEDYQRLDQVGVVDGELVVRGERWPVQQWWACRDHSWGVRPGVGGWDPITGATPPVSEVGTLFAFLFFSTDDYAGHVQIMERGRERVYMTGLLRERNAPDRLDLHVTTAEMALRFFEGTRRIEQADFAVTCDDGRSATFVTSALGSSIAMPGLGYSGGWNDGRALGAWRGDQCDEIDMWEVRHPVDVVHEDGTVDRPVHRIQPVTVAGTTGAGTGSLTLIANGSLPQYNL
ncbi:MAG: hypothetical protein ABI658_03990 [Acidimicrobiales bacterium]